MDNTFKASGKFAKTLVKETFMVEISDQTSSPTLEVPLDLIVNTPGDLKDEVEEWLSVDNGVYTLNLNSDDRRATIALLHYMVHGTLPADYDTSEKDAKLQFTLSRAWRLGAEYDMPLFQDMVMHALLKQYDPEAREISGTGEARYFGQEDGNVKSQLWYLILEGLAYGINNGSIEFHELEAWKDLNDDPNFWNDWATAQSKCGRNRLEEGKDYWKEYMVSEGIAKPWAQHD